MESKLTQSVAIRLRGVLGERRMSQTQLADGLHVSRMYVSRRLNDEVDMTFADLEIMLGYLGIPIPQFLEEVARSLERHSAPAGDRLEAVPA